MDNSIERIEVLEENELFEEVEQIEVDQRLKDDQRSLPQTRYARGAANVGSRKRGASISTGRGCGRRVVFQFRDYEAASSIRQPLLNKTVKLRFLHPFDVDEVLLFFCMLSVIQSNKALHPSVFDVVEVLPVTSKKVSLLPLPFQPPLATTHSKKIMKSALLLRYRAID